MLDELISYDTAQLAKKAGFDVETRYYYEDRRWGKKPVASFGPMNHNNNRRWDNDKCMYVESDIRQSAPTLGLIQKWLREEKGWCVLPTINLYWNKWICRHYTEEDGDYTLFGIENGVQYRLWGSYEDAVRSGIAFALTYLTENQA